MNICDYFFEHDKQSVAIITQNGSKTTYGELDVLSNRSANCLNAVGFTKGDCLLLQGDNSLNMIVLWCAAVKCGGSVVFTSNVHSDVQIDSISEQTKSKIKLKNKQIDLFVAQSQEFSDTFETVQVECEDICIYTLSSGTTGIFSKVISHTHESARYSSIKAMEFVGEPNTKDAFYSTAHLSFSLGLACGLVTPLLYGSSTVMTPKLALIDTLKTIKYSNVTRFFSSPSFYKEAIKLNAGDYFKLVDICISGGDFLSPKVREDWEKQTGKYLTNILGTADTLFYFICSKQNETPLNSIGLIVPGYKVECDDDSLMIVETPFSKFTPGDKIYIKDECVYYLGREDDIINTPYGKVNPAEVENILMETGLLKDVFVIQYTKMDINFLQVYGIKSDELNDIDVREEILEYSKKYLPKHMVPKKINFVKSLPRTFSGKPQRKLMKGLK
jgi:acyl-coenzyme A synthetase/AMP-(fatty) acid ligase